MGQIPTMEELYDVSMINDWFPSIGKNIEACQRE